MSNSSVERKEPVLDDPITINEIDFKYLREDRFEIALSLFQEHCQNASSKREQIFILYSRGQDSIPKLSMDDIGILFQISRQRVWKTIQQFKKWNGIGTVGRPTLLSKEQWEVVDTYINNQFEQKAPCTFQRLLNFIYETFGLLFSLDTIRHIFYYNNKYRNVKGIRMEANRVLCDEKEIDKWFDDLKSTFSFQIPAAFITNVDEVGFGGREMDRDTTCVVPNCYVGDTIPVSQDIEIDHHTMIAAIVADGSYVKPLIVIQRDTIDTELIQLGYTYDKVLFSKSDTGYINSKIFKKWLIECYIKDVEAKRITHNYYGPAILILDGCSCHGTTEFVDILEEKNIFLRFIPSHSSDQIQPLDLGIFANLKGRMSNIYLDSDLSIQTREVIRIFDSFVMASLPRCIIGAFRRSGIVLRYSRNDETLLVDVDERYANNVRHFQQNPDISLSYKNRKRIKI